MYFSLSADLEDDSATVFDSRDALRLEIARTGEAYTLPVSSRRAQALDEVRRAGLWDLFVVAATCRSAWHRPEFVAYPEAASLATKAVDTAHGATEDARRAFQRIRRVPEATDDIELDRVADLGELLSAAERNLAEAREVAAWLETRVTSDPLLRRWGRLTPAQLEYASSLAGFVRLVFRKNKERGRAADVLTKRGMSRYWTLVGYGIRLRPVPRNRREFRAQQATWRQAVMREYKRQVQQTG